MKNIFDRNVGWTVPLLPTFPYEYDLDLHFNIEDWQVEDCLVIRTKRGGLTCWANSSGGMKSPVWRQVKHVKMQFFLLRKYDP